MRFVDTNVLLYAVGAPSADADKRLRALGLLTPGDLALSVWVLQAFHHQATRLRAARNKSATAQTRHWNIPQSKVR